MKYKTDTSQTRGIGILVLKATHGEPVRPIIIIGGIHGRGIEVHIASVRPIRRR